MYILLVCHGIYLMGENYFALAFGGTLTVGITATTDLLRTPTTIHGLQKQ